MTETLSERLCKECEIEAIKKNCNPCQKCVTCEWYRGVQGNKINKHKSIKECQKEHFIYPNFGNSNNYIRLEEIMLTELAKHHLTVVKWVHYWLDNTLMYEYILITKTGHKIRFKHNDIQVNNWFVERENRADCLILFILWKVIPICGESIKQAIREADWEY